MAEPAATIQPTANTSDVVFYCPGCFYDLRGSAADACPECGAKLDREQLAKSSIPWVHRKGLGAFVKTAWLATFKTQLFCLEVARPVSLRDARKFRQQVVAMLTIVVLLLIAGLLLMLEDTRDPMEDLWRNRPILMAFLSILPVIPIGVFMLGFTGIHMYWFHPKALPIQQQNRAVAVSHYACAPLVGLVPAIVGFGIGNLIGVMSEKTDSDVLLWIAIGLLLVSMVAAFISVAAYLFVCAHMARYAANRGGPARVTLWLGLPALWLGLAGLLFFVLPVVGFYMYLIVSSF